MTSQSELSKKMNKTSILTQLQEALADLLISSGVEEDALVGTMLVLKNSVQEQEEMLLYIWDNKPTPDEIDKKLVDIVERRNEGIKVIIKG